MLRRVSGPAMILLLMVWGCGSESGGPTSPSPGDPGPGNPGNPASSRGLISIAIDDGWRSTYTNAFPILDGAGIKSSNYIITGRFNDPSYIGRTEILNIQARGHEVGAHTRTHMDLVTMSSAQLQAEVAGSKSDLLGIGIRSVDTFAYPFGAYNATVVQAVKDARFTGARTSNGGFNSRSTDKYLLARQNLGNRTTIEQVRSWMDTINRDDSWLILVAHHIDYTDTEFSITPEFFRDIIGEISKRRIRTVTISEGVR